MHILEMEIIIEKNENEEETIIKYLDRVLKLLNEINLSHFCENQQLVNFINERATIIY